MSSLPGPVERVLAEAVSLPALSRLAGWLSDRRLPGPVLLALLRAYVRAYGVDMSQSAEPLAAFPTFGAFFTRRLRPGARPIAASLVVSPSDSRLQTVGPVPADGRLEQVKGRTYSIEALLG
jgi:phosphatidylserine decarboxylase